MHTPVSAPSDQSRRNWAAGLLAVMLAGLFFCLSTSPVSSAEKKQAAPGQSPYRVYLTAQTKNKIPEDKPIKEFDCSERIYAVSEIHWPKRKTPANVKALEHSLVTKFFDPNKKQREKIDQKLWEAPGHRSRTWAWMKLKPPAGSSVVQFVDPSYGMKEFIGVWSLKVYLDNKLIVAQKFDVIC